jgi:hypothetical protein
MEAIWSSARKGENQCHPANSRSETLLPFNPVSVGLWRLAFSKWSNHRLLLSARQERPRRRAAEQGDEAAPFQFIELALGRCHSEGSQHTGGR